MTEWDTCARSANGSLRDRNEDSHLAAPEDGLFAVADGMGGQMSGDVASEIFVETLEDHGDRLAETARRGDPTEDLDLRERLVERLKAAMLEANREIFSTGRGEMGTTGDVLVLGDRAALVGHVGDSRTYLVRDGELNRLTTDHTYGAERDTDGEFEHVLTRALGTEPDVQIDTIFLELQPGDTFVLCTDGVTRHVDDETIRRLADRHDSEGVVDGLFDRVRSDGGVDDTTAIAVELADDAGRAFERNDSVETTRKIELLQRVGLFEGLEERTILRLLRHVYTAEFPAGDRLVVRGNQRGAMYVLVSGTVSVRRDGHELARLSEGDHVGEISLVDDGPRTADVVAEQPVRALEIQPEDFFEILEDDPRVGNALLENLLRHCVRRLRATNEELLVSRSGSDR